MTKQIGDFSNATVDDVMLSSMMTTNVLRTFEDWNKELPTWRRDEIVYNGGARVVRVKNLQGWCDFSDWPMNANRRYLSVDGIVA